MATSQGGSRTMENTIDLAKGKWQEGVLLEMLSDSGCCGPLRLRGRAKTYSASYHSSLLALFDRLREHGLGIIVKPGPNGGMGYGSKAIFYARTKDEADVMLKEIPDDGIGKVYYRV